MAHRKTFLTFNFFYKQPVYKQLAFRWQIPEQLSVLRYTKV